MNALILLFAIKNELKALVQRLLNDQQVLDDEPLLVDEIPLDEASVFSCAGPAGEISLLQAAKQAAARYIRQGDPVQNEGATPPLPLSCWAVQAGYLTVVARLLEVKGILVNVDNFPVWGSLHKAASVGNAEVVRFILSQRGLNVDSEDEQGYTAFELAACGSHEQAVVELISGGANVETKPYIHPTIFERVAGAGYALIVQHMINAGVDVLNPECHAIHKASRAGHIDIVQSLLNAGVGANDNPGPWCGTALQEASGGGHQHVVQMLLKAGADVNAAGRSLPHKSLEGIPEEELSGAIKKLCDAGQATGRYGITAYGTALYEASLGGHLAVVVALLQAGANVSWATGIYGSTALHAASRGGHLSVVEALLKTGADTNQKVMPETGTPLEVAAKGGHLYVVEALINAGAHVNATTGYQSHSALQWAAAGGHRAVVEALLQAGAHINRPVWDHRRTAMHEAVDRGDAVILEILLMAGGNFYAIPGKSIPTEGKVGELLRDAGARNSRW